MSTDDADELVDSMKARATALRADDIQDLAQRAIEQINSIADEASTKGLQVEALMQELAELRGRGGDEQRP